MQHAKNKSLFVNIPRYLPFIFQMFFPSASPSKKLVRIRTSFLVPFLTLYFNARSVVFASHFVAYRTLSFDVRFVFPVCKIWCGSAPDFQIDFRGISFILLSISYNPTLVCGILFPCIFGIARLFVLLATNCFLSPVAVFSYSQNLVRIRTCFLGGSVFSICRFIHALIY